MDDGLRNPKSRSADRPGWQLHEGEIEAQRRFDFRGRWTETHLRSMFCEDIPPHFAKFVESQPFFFMSTANARGECDCSFRSREVNASGQPYPLVKVLDPKTLIFPDYEGNKLFCSLGNIIENPNIGMLFVDFEVRTRLRINGRATIIEDRSAYASLWPLAERYVRVTPTQVFPNCRARIPHMTMTDPLAGYFLED